MHVLYSQTDFITDLIARVNKAEKRVYIQCLYFEIDDTTRPLITALKNTSKRKVDIRINIDWISGKYVGGDLKPLNDADDKNRALVKVFKNTEIKISIMNNPNWWQRLLPIMGRNHAKIWIIDDTLWIGGINLSEANFDCEDFMVRFDMTGLTKALAERFVLASKGKLLKDYSCKFEDGFELLFDAGIIGQSVVYDKAIEIVSRANKAIFFISQLTPDGKLLTELIKVAKRGVEVYIITSSKNDVLYSKFPFKLIYYLFLFRIANTKRVHFSHFTHRIHDKLLIIDDLAVLFGSQNLVWSSVMLGTGEANIYTTNIDLVRQFVQYKDRLLRFT